MAPMDGAHGVWVCLSHMAFGKECIVVTRYPELQRSNECMSSRGRDIEIRLNNMLYVMMILAL